MSTTQQFSTQTSLVIFSYGLPLSRLYARLCRNTITDSPNKTVSRYFRGDIQIASVDGYGTDVYVYLQRLR